MSSSRGYVCRLDIPSLYSEFFLLLWNQTLNHLTGWRKVMPPPPPEPTVEGQGAPCCPVELEQEHIMKARVANLSRVQMNIDEPRHSMTTWTAARVFSSFLAASFSVKHSYKPDHCTTKRFPSPQTNDLFLKCYLIGPKFSTNTWNCILSLKWVVINMTDESCLVIKFFQWVSKSYPISHSETAIWKNSFLDYFLPRFGFSPW